MMSSLEYDDVENFHMRRNISYSDASNQSPKLSGNGKRGRNCSSSSYKYCSVALTVAVAVLVLSVVAACIGFALEITKLKSEMASLLDQATSLQQNLSNCLNNVTLNTD